MRIAVLMTCFNRVDTTIACLRRLFVCVLPRGFAFDVWLNDDGCTDDTAKCVANEFSRVNIIKGSGHDYWCGGMRRVWQSAIDSGVDYDGYLWLNDDTMLYPIALEHMVVTSDGIVVGATEDEMHSHITYSGRNECGDKLIPNGTLQRCHEMNGNVVYVSKSAFEAVGNFPTYMTHGIGDFDYALRARERGIGVWLADKVVGVCNEKIAIDKWNDENVPFYARLKCLYSPLGGAEPPLLFRHDLEHYGWRCAIRVWMCQHLQVCLPGVYNRIKRLRAK